MKKITLLVVAGLAISFASCKKDYTCTCTGTTTGSSTSSTSTTVIKGVSKKAAQANCLSSDSKDASGTVYYTKSCTLSK